MSSVMLKMQGVRLENKREKDDYYPTQSHAIETLLHNFSVPREVWEPCCGQGHISKALREHGHEVTATDLVDRGEGIPRVDFLMELKPLAPAIVTNPPFRLATDFIAKALDFNLDFIAMLLKADFWHAVKTDILWQRRVPAYVIPIKRPDFTGQGRPFLNCQWTIWSGWNKNKFANYKPIFKT